MFMHKSKKGFTIVELVIVIAVIAILAAVLIPTFSNLVKKANLSADQQAIANMNKAAAIEGATGLDYAGDVVAAIYANGFNAGKLQTYTAGHHYAYDFENNEFYLLDETGVVVYPEKETSPATLWGFFNNDTHDKIPGVTKYIALTSVYSAVAYNEIFAEGSTYTLDLNKTYINVAGKDYVTIQNGQVKVGSDFVRGKGIVEKAVATASSATTANNVYTLKDVVVTEDTFDVIGFEKMVAANGGARMGTQMNITDATTVKFENVTFDFGGTNYGLAFGVAGSSTVTSYVFDGCTFIFDAQNVFITGDVDIKPDVTVKNCYFSSGRGLVVGINSSLLDESVFGDVLIENNTFVDNGTGKDKPSIQFASRVSSEGAKDGTYVADSITIKNNTFVCSDVAIKIHGTTATMNCDNVTISGNNFGEKCKKIDGDGTSASNSIATEWVAKIK